MDTLYLMVTITDRKLEKKFLNFYREQGLEVSLTTLSLQRDPGFLRPGRKRAKPSVSYGYREKL